MAIKSTQEIRRKKKPEMDSFSLNSSVATGDSDSESTSATSSMQSSISSAASSLDQNSSNVKEASLEKKTLKKSISKKFANFGSFISSRRRSSSRLGQPSVKVPDDESITPTHSSSVDPRSSSIEASDESTNYDKKPVPKFTRAGSLRSVKILRSKSKNKNKSTSKSKKSSTKKNLETSEESRFESSTFSSTLKDSKFPEHLKHQTGPLEPEEILPEAKVCPYQHCSLHGHHNHDPPQKRFAYLKRRTKTDQKTVTHESQPMDGKKRETKETKRVSNEVDFSIEFYAKTRSEPVSSYGYDDAEFANILKNEKPIIKGFVDMNDENDDGSNGSKRVLKKKSSLEKTNNISMWHMIHQHMVSGLEAESGDTILQQEHEDKKSIIKDFDDDMSQETEIRKMFAIKLVRDAIEKILLPEVQDDHSTTSEVISEQDLSETGRNGGETISDPKEKPSKVTEKVETRTGSETEKRAPNRWSYLKKVILLTKFVNELEKVKKFNPKKVIIPSAFEHAPETVSLRKQTTGDKKSSDEWMLDYALQKVVGELAPTQKRKVALLVKAFETVAPAQECQQESRSNSELQRVSSEIKEISEPEIKSGTNVVPNLFSGNEKDSGPDSEKEKHIKMWHMIYQHVATDIVTKIGSDLLLDGEESDDSERDFGIAVKLVRASVNEILLPDFSDTQSVASDIVSEQDFGTDENKNPRMTKFQQQSSKNWTKLKKLILLKRSIKALEGFRNLKPKNPEREILKGGQGDETVDLKSQTMDERKKAEQWMLDYAVQHIVTKLTPARKKRVSMLVEAFEAVVPFPEI